MKAAPQSLIAQITDKLYLADQIDLLHLAIASLDETVRSGDTDLILEQVGKSAQQKKLYLDKLVASVRSPELQTALAEKVREGDIDFFLRKNFAEFLDDLENTSEDVQIVRLTVAVKFKDADIRHLVALLADRLGHPVAFDLQVDPTLIGGAIIQYGSYLNDYSLKSRLSTFREHWKQAAFEKLPA